MFKIEVLCDDKNLARLLRGLTGLTLGVPRVVPVVNAEASGGKVRAETDGSLVSMLDAYLRRHKLTNVGAAEIKQFAVASGYAVGSYTFIIRKATDANLLRKRPGKGTGSKAVYTVIGGK
jgi:hypothetical protein